MFHSKCFCTVDCNRKKRTPTPFTLVITLKLLATNESCEKQQFFEQHKCPLVSEGISYIILWNRLYKDMRVEHRKTTSEWNYRFWINLLLLSAITSGVMRNDLFVFKIFILTPYCRLKKRTLTEMTTRWYSPSLIVTCRHSLSLASFVVPLVTILCRYHSSVFLSAILGKQLQIRRRHLHVLYKANTLTKSKMFRKIWRPASANLSFDFIKTVLHHGHIAVEYSDFFWKSYFTKQLWLLVRGDYLFG